MRCSRYLAVGVLSLLCLATLRGEEPAIPRTPVPDKATLEKNFAEMLSGATLVGHFTMNELGENQPAKVERYTLTKVSKVGDDLWLFQARMQYGKTDVTLPLTLEVKWAGDTPVLTMTDFPIPGMGKFTCRIIFFRDEYAGTWNGGPNHGGHMYGKIVREEKK